MTKKSKFPDINKDPAYSFISGIAFEDLPDDAEQAALPEVINHDSEKKKTESVTGGAEPSKAPAGYKKNPEYVELKSKRLQLVLQPSVFDALKKAAKASKLSVNEYCNRLIEASVKGE